ncbi:MAG: amidohydrolase [Polyangiaceae bacterium]|nr:amidohydrolase [Polyangiaceae bacterium]
MPEPVTVIVGADVRVLDRAGRRAEAVAWRGSRLVAVGARAEVERAAGDGALVRDVAGATVLPGFLDLHHHSGLGALYGSRVSLAAPAVRDLPTLQAKLVEAARELPTGRWLVAIEWDEATLAERRAPTRAELDAAVPDRPVFALHYSCHRAVANARALELAGIDRHTPEPLGGVIERGPGGVPRGLLIERAMSRVETLARADLVAHDADAFVERLREHHRGLVAVGITHVIDAAVPPDLRALYEEAARRQALLVPTTMMPVSLDGYLEPAWGALGGPVTGAGEGVLRIGPLKLILDGAPACAMCLRFWQAAGAAASAVLAAARAAHLDPLRAMLSVAPQPLRGARVRTGLLLHSPRDVRDLVRGAAARGFAVATHAVGNAAVDLALDALTAERALAGRAARPRIEHAWFVSREQVARIAGEGLSVVTQPHFVSLPAFASAPRVPGLRGGALRWLLDAGALVAGSSDYPVAGFDPLAAVRSAVERRTCAGHTYEPDQCVELEEALALYTRTAAEVAGCLGAAGTLEAGKRADLVLLDRRLERGTLAEARVATTVIGGRVVHGGLGAGAPPDGPPP